MVLAQGVAMQIARRRGMKKAIVPLARRLAVIMHRIWVDGSEFRWTREAVANMRLQESKATGGNSSSTAWWHDAPRGTMSRARASLRNWHQGPFSALPSDERRIQATKRTHLIQQHRHAAVDSLKVLDPQTAD
jgi:hypothetical protein